MPRSRVARRVPRESASSDAPADIIGNTDDDDDDATCSLRARDDTAAKFRFEGTRRLYGDRRFDRLARAHDVHRTSGKARRGHSASASERHCEWRKDSRRVRASMNARDVVRITLKPQREARLFFLEMKQAH